MTRIFLVFFLLIAAPAVAQQCTPAPQGETCGSVEFQACTLTVAGRERTYCQHNPDQGGSLPVVLVYHGSGGKAGSMVNLMRSYTEQSKVIVVPQAERTRYKGECSIRWRQLGQPVKDWTDFVRADDCAGGDMASDLDFTAALLDHFRPRAQDFYAMGFSNGGGFMFQLMITQGLAQQFAGLAAIGNGIIAPKRAALDAPAARYGPNRETPVPILFHMATRDKRNFAADELIAALEANPGCGSIDTPRRMMDCFIATHFKGEEGLYDMPTIRSITRDWLVAFNNANPARHESLYPNLGQGQAPSDETMTVREDYFEKAGETSAAVAVLTTIDGGHEMPGWGGNRAPCPSQNCDIDLVHEIIQFWRAHSGMKLPLK